MRLSCLSRLLTDTLQTGAAPGAALALSVKGERIDTAVGLANTSSGAPLAPGSRFQLGCITKLLTSLVALELAGAGRLDLDEPIATYLPDMADLEPVRSTTAKHLLSHTSGYQGINVADPVVRHYFTWPKFLDVLRTGERLFQAGSVFNYEHTECVLMGEILQRITGQHPHELYRARIFEPLGIQCGTLRGNAPAEQHCVMDHTFDAGAGRYVPLRAVPYCRFWDASLSDLTMSLSDLVTLGSAAAGFDGRGVFSAFTIEAVRRPHVGLPRALGGQQREQMPIAFGWGCAQYGESVFGHNGSARGQTCALRFDLSTQLVMAVGLSCWRAHVRDLLCAKVIAAFSPTAPADQRGGVMSGSFADLVGRYLGASGTSVEVSASEADPGLDICLRGNSSQAVARMKLHRECDGKWAVSSDTPHLTVGFFSPPDSSARALMVGLNAYRHEADRVATPEVGFTEDELENMTRWIDDPALRAILGQC